jgi:hypothetical protein
MSKTPTTSSPVDVADTVDPGDEMQRNVRYQHAYGVILLVGALRDAFPYVSIWCEQHEDYLAERHDGLYDALQIKTATPENGGWVWSADGLRASIKRFVRLDKKFPGRIKTFIFVSNVTCHESNAKGQIKRSPPLLVNAIIAEALLDGELKEALSTLCGHCECTEDELKKVLRRLNFQPGPPREHMVAVVAHQHLPQCHQCRNMSAVDLDACFDAIAQIVLRASSRDVRDGSQDYWAIANCNRTDPFVEAKRITVSAIREILNELRGAPFIYSAVKNPLKIGHGKDYLSVMEKKLLRGGLAEYIGTVAHRAESAERHLIEMQVLDPAGFDAKLNQLESVVKALCDEARLEASAGKSPYGEAMLREVFKRLKELATSKPEMVFGEEYDLLAGLAGLLTGDCKIWWSEQFKLEEVA